MVVVPQWSTQKEADTAAKHMRRMADWFHFSILKENKLGR
jgi:hypothetical protein